MQSDRTALDHRGWRGALLAVAICLGLLQCGREPIMVLDVDETSLPADAISLRLRSRLGGNEGREALFDVGRQQIAVYLPEDVGGPIELELTALSAGGCGLARWRADDLVPGGLARFASLRSTLVPLGSPQCQLSVTVEEGVDRVTSSPPGIDCHSGSVGTCAAELPSGPILLTASSGPRSSLSWSSACAGPAASCTLSLTRAQQVQVGAQPQICSPDGWCWLHPLPQGQSLFAAAKLDASRMAVVGQGGTILFCSEPTGACTPLSSGTTQTLTAVWGSDANNV